MADSLWDQVDIIYNAYRDTELNRKYYGYRLHRYQTWNQVMEIAIAIGGASSVLSWQVWTSDAGKVALPIILAVSALLAIAKPILGLGKQIERCSKLFAGYTAVYHDLDELVSQIQVDREVAPAGEKTLRSQETYS
jgi:hypothetical protein